MCVSVAYVLVPSHSKLYPAVFPITCTAKDHRR